MAENSFIDIFDLCWNAILKESVDNNNTFFSEKHCSMDESRDTNFDLVENRLAYTYKFGGFNTLLVQKCLENFLDKHSEGKEVFLRDFKVCSLSNGPGFDLLGLYCGIYKSNQNLKSLPVFKTINLYNSWWSICHRIFTRVFQAAGESSNNSFKIPPKIIHFMQCDIYSTLSCDAKECIKDSDILLMVKVFASTKATSDVVIKSMTEIFSLLKPGSFVFFVGSKKNTKELTANDLLSKFVNCILGPIKISVADLPINEAVVKKISVKPKTSGSAYFIVWQKKDSVSLDTVPKKKRKKKKSIIQVEKEFIESNALSQQTDDSNSSETYSSHSKQSETSSDDSCSAPCEKVSQSISPDEIHLPHLGKEKPNLTLKKSFSVDSITFLLDKINLDTEKVDLTAIKDIIKPGKESIRIPEKNCQAKELESCLVTEGVLIQTKSEDNLLNETNSSKQTVDVEINVNRVPYKPDQEESNFCEKVNVKKVLTHLNKELHLIQKYPPPMEENSTSILNNNNAPVNSSNKQENLQAIQFNTILSSNDSISKLKKTKKNKTHAITQTDSHSPSNIQQEERGKTSANKIASYLSLGEGIYNEACNGNSSSRENPTNIFQGTVLKAAIQHMNDKHSLPNANISTIKIKPRIPEDKSHKNSMDLKFNAISAISRTAEINDRNKDLNLLLHRCENLVTSLEKLTASFKNSISFSNDQDTKCCYKKSCTKFQIQHACINPCCFNPVQSHCCRKFCNCHMFHYTSCPKHM